MARWSPSGFLDRHIIPRTRADGRLERVHARTRWAGPDLGVHNEKILCGEPGLSAKELDALVESGAVGVALGDKTATGLI